MGRICLSYLPGTAIHVLSLTSELWTLEVEGIQWIGVDYFGCTLSTVGHVFRSLAFILLRCNNTNIKLQYVILSWISYGTSVNMYGVKVCLLDASAELL